MSGQDGFKVSRDKRNDNMWPAVALVGVLLAFVLGLILILRLT